MKYENMLNIPDELKGFPNWVLWKLEKRDGEAKDTKVPYQLNGKKAMPNNSRTWSSWGEVWAKCPEYSGVGIMFAQKMGIVGIDFDDVRNPENGEIDPTALNEVSTLNSYTEVSPSGTGLHTFVKGKIPCGGRRLNKREMYQDVHYLTVTGEHLAGTPREIRENQEALDTMFIKWFPEKNKPTEIKDLSIQRDVQVGGGWVRSPELSDKEVTSKIMRLNDGAKLLFGDISDYDGNDSSADLALCCKIAFYTQDKEQIERILKGSALYREKHNRPDYIDRTIQAALNGLTKTWQPGKQKKPEEAQEEGGKEKEKRDYVAEFPEDIQKKARDILENGDAFQFMLDTYSQTHVGDINICENVLVSAASTRIINSEGLHTKPSGGTGKGKSSGTNDAAKLLPPRMVLIGSFSPKSLFYDDSLEDGLLIVTDEIDLTSKEEIKEILKRSVTDFQNRIQYKTLVKQAMKTLFLPARIAWCLPSVDALPDTQLSNRFLNCDVDGSPEQDERVGRHILAQELRRVVKPNTERIEVCRCMWEILDTFAEREIIIPFAEAIEWTNWENRRNLKKFLDVIRAVAYFKHAQREKYDGLVLAELEDFYRGLKIYMGTSVNNATNLSNQELEIVKKTIALQDIGTGENATYKTLAQALRVGEAAIKHIINGRDGKGGILEKLVGFNKEMVTITTGDEKERRGRPKIYFTYSGELKGLGLYATPATIDEKKAAAQKTVFLETLTREI